ncbi:ABC transporter permease [Lachnospiraceae bacterium 54-53]
MTIRKKAVPIVKAFTPKASIARKYVIILGISSFAIILAVWSLLTYTGIINPMLMPTPTKTVQMGVQLFTEQNYSADIGMTVFRVMLGFALAALVAIPLGILIGVYAPVSAFFESIFSFIRYMPASAFIPLFILWIGIGEDEKVAVIILGSLPQLILMVATSTRNVSKSLIEVSYTLGTTKANVLWKVILPKATPDILDNVRIVLGWAWTYVIVAEMVGASSGIGYMIIQSQRMLSTPKMFVGILTIGLIGLFVDNLIRFLNRKLFAWN